jgi:DtxR family transcriptional regulator, Mn-dependent transcriptional regulator
VTSASSQTQSVFHPPVEEYLQAIASLSDEDVPVIQARIAERLGKTSPAVSEMLDRLAVEGYIKRSGRRIALTPAGQRVASGVIRKHRLAERLLVDVIGLPWHLIHIEAGRWEHVISDEVELRLIELLGDPGTCPHGNPIPGSANQPTLSGQTALADVAAGDQVRFVRLTEEVELNQATLRYLDESGFTPGTTATVRTRAPDNTVILDVHGTVVALGPALSQRLFVVAA